MLRLFFVIICILLVCQVAFAQEFTVSDPETHSWLDSIHQRINGIKAWLEQTLNQWMDDTVYAIKTFWSLTESLAMIPGLYLAQFMEWCSDEIEWGSCKLQLMVLNQLGNWLGQLSVNFPTFSMKQLISGNVLLGPINVFFPLDLIATFSSLILALWTFHLAGGVFLRIVRIIT